ncbi:MAG: prephenate dehydrogenase [uncultured archaeon A07HB70]|nr:MAG: prephenate dehydrogenase [uncultured archaeon A07HB70]
MDLLVVGAGAVGRWFAGVAGADRVAFADVDDAAARAAAERAGGRTAALDGDESFDAVCLAVPMPVAPEAVARHAPRAERALLDVVGTMAPPVAAGRNHAPDRERLSLHPLFAPNNAPGNVAAVHDAPGPLTDGVRAALDGNGNSVFDTTAAEHDEAMRTVQAAAHAAVLAYGLAREAVRDEFATPVSRGLDDLVATVTGNSPRVYRDVQRTFDGASAVAEAARRVATADDEAFERLYREARETEERHEAGADRADGGGR